MLLPSTGTKRLGFHYETIFPKEKRGRNLTMAYNYELSLHATFEHGCCQEVCGCAVISSPNIVYPCVCSVCVCAQMLQGTLVENESPNKLASGAERSADRVLGLNWAQSTTNCHASVCCYVFLVKEKWYPWGITSLATW